MPAKKKTPARKATPAVRGPQAAASQRDVEVTVSIEVGRATCTLDELLQFGENSMVELDRVVGEPVDILLNDGVVARGEVVTVGENFGVRVTELVNKETAS